MKNLQGDMIAITDRNGLVVARYSYDAWGVCMMEQESATHIGSMNPYRYRRNHWWSCGAALGYLLADALGLKGWKKWALVSAATVGEAVLV